MKESLGVDDNLGLGNNLLTVFTMDAFPFSCLSPYCVVLTKSIQCIPYSVFFVSLEIWESQEQSTQINILLCQTKTLILILSRYHMDDISWHAASFPPRLYSYCTALLLCYTNKSDTPWSYSSGSSARIPSDVGATSITCTRVS